MEILIHFVGVNSTCCETSDFADFASSRLASNSADSSEASGPSAEILPLSEHQSPKDTTVDIDDGDRILEPSCEDYIGAELASPASTAVRERPPLVTTSRASLLSADEEELMDMILREVGV
ncbi:hypothetical protein FOZ60_008061 [Perkinsus olseni]|uniref:Uncharacterized protein n=1 Tax=Perkinsus olseni TaxID=32597 RepID=A0A7J6PE51_PEROL|nr:hypothetical protein FOZ60_008061 [Perkinsus olseni]